MEKRVIPVLEMSCAVCAATVEKTVRELTGVEEASVNFSANTLQVVEGYAGCGKCRRI